MSWNVEEVRILADAAERDAFEALRDFIHDDTGLRNRMEAVITTAKDAREQQDILRIVERRALRDSLEVVPLHDVAGEPLYPHSVSGARWTRPEEAPSTAYGRGNTP